MRHAMGVAVFSRMLGVTFFGLLLTPVFYLVIRAFVEKREARKSGIQGGPRMKFFALSLLALTITGCAVGPDYRAPQPEPARLLQAERGDHDRSRFEAAWWRQFEDPTLDALVGEALAENRELRIAYARLRAARAIRDDVGNDRLPTVTAGARADIGKAQQPGFSEERVNAERYDLGLDMAWELDLFGRIQRSLEASEAQAEAAEAELYQLQVSLIAELVDAYGQLRGAQLRERIARDNLANQRNSHELTEQLREAGVGSELDVLRADARLAATEASLPQLQAQQTRARNRIATLLGQRADQLSVDLSPRELPAIAKALPIGDPGELLRRRPDIRAAERQLAAATANVGVATADLFPRVSLSGFRLHRRTRLADRLQRRTGLGRSAQHQLGGVRPGQRARPSARCRGGCRRRARRL